MDHRGTAAVAQAVAARWRDAGLDAVFNNYWTAAQRAGYNITLHDGEAEPTQPWPYCVFLLPTSEPTGRMSGGNAHILELRDTPLEFMVYARKGTSMQAKTLASQLAGAIVRAYGGHPDVAAAPLSGTYLVQPRGEYGVRIGADEWRWVVKYMVRSCLRQAS